MRIRNIYWLLYLHLSLNCCFRFRRQNKCKKTCVGGDRLGKKGVLLLQSRVEFVYGLVQAGVLGPPLHSITGLDHRVPTHSPLHRYRYQNERICAMQGFT
jgi:hypothetical protein